METNWHVAPGDPTRVFVGTCSPIKCGSKERARLIAAAPALLEALKTTAGNIRSLGPARALDDVPMPYRVWLEVVEEVIAKAEGL